MTDSDGNYVLNYISDWRSRDLFKAWNENDIGQLEEINDIFNSKKQACLEELEIRKRIENGDYSHEMNAMFH